MVEIFFTLDLISEARHLVGRNQVLVIDVAQQYFRIESNENLQRPTMNPRW